MVIEHEDPTLPHQTAIARLLSSFLPAIGSSMVHSLFPSILRREAWDTPQNSCQVYTYCDGQCVDSIYRWDKNTDKNTH